MDASHNDPMKTCSSCLRHLSLAHFTRYRQSPDGLTSNCTDCNRESSRRFVRNRYGISDPTRSKYSSMVYNLAIHNETMVALALLRENCQMIGFHIGTKAMVSFQVTYQAQLFTVRLLDGAGNLMLARMFPKSADLELIRHNLAFELRDMHIRIEKDHLGMHEAKTILYYL